MLDYWEAIRGGERRLIPEHEWTERWRNKVDGMAPGTDALVVRSFEEDELARLVRAHGQSDGISMFRDWMNQRGAGTDGEIWVRSWERDPW